MSTRVLLASAVVAVLAAAGGAAHALRVPAAPRCPVFPKSNPWTRRVARLPVAKSSAAVIASIGAGTGLHADFGSGLWDGSPIGIPFDFVSRNTPRSRVSFEYSDESDHVGYPIPKRVHIEGGSDHHALLLDKTACRLYELGGLQKQNGRWHAWIVLVALKRYGMIVADNGSNWYISGAPNRGWSNDQLHTLGRVTGSEFEVVDTSSLKP